MQFLLKIKKLSFQFLLVLSIGFAFFNSKTFALEPLKIESFDSEINFTKHTETYQDPTNTLTISDISGGISEKFSFVKTTTNKVNYGFSKSTVWMHAQFLNMTNTSPTDTHNPLLYLSSSMIQNVELFLFEDGKQILHKTISQFKPLNFRDFPARLPVFKILLQKAKLYDVYLKINSSDTIIFSAHLSAEKVFIASETKFQLFQGLYFGAIIALIIYNGFIYFTTRSPVYLYYIFSLFSLNFLFQLNFTGLFSQYLIPNHQHISGQLNPYFGFLCGITFTKFAYVFLDFKSIRPQTKKSYVLINILKFTPLIGIILIFLLFWIQYPVFTKISGLFSLVSSTMCIFAGLFTLKKNVPTAKIYLISWSFLLLGSIGLVLMMLNLVEATSWLKYSMQIGSLLESLLLSFALANRIKSLSYKLEQEKILSNFKAQKARLEELGLVAVRLGDKLNTPLNIIVLALEAIEDNCKEKDQNYDQSESYKFSRQIEFQIKKLKSELEHLEKFKTYLPERPNANIENLFEDAEKKSEMRK